LASIAHLSDLHFGRHDPKVVDALEQFLFEQKPDLVVVSGDFTQRARTSQFQLACRFLARLDQAGLDVLAVPGNHDVPLYDVARRFVRPLHRYRRFVSDDLCPWWENSELAILGVNTARSLTFKDGSISHHQLRRIREMFDGGADGRLRVLVTHHPLLVMPFGENGRPAGGVNRGIHALAAAAEARVDLLLAGHFHRSFSRSAREIVDNVGPSLVVQAGTATSTRLRGGECQSFNWIQASREKLEISVHAWERDGFRAGKPARFRFDGVHWHGAAGA
jgi:3',5'-cyclic AMP phosphodiesterase CpdA